MSDDLIAFLRARLAEDEATARAVAWDGSGNSLSWGLAASATVEVGNDEFNTDDRTVANHIVNHDPARVLREVEAKRRILTDVVSEMDSMTDQIHLEWGAGPLDPTTRESLILLRLLALPYADHPDFRDEWRPTAS
jgi:hypothetical protein